jgi:hypothetical protein
MKFMFIYGKARNSTGEYLLQWWINFSLRAMINMYNKIWRRRYGSKKRNFPVTLLIFASEGRTGDPTNLRIILRMGRVIYQYVLMRNTPEAGARGPGRSVPHPVRLEVSGTTADLGHAVEPDTSSLRSKPVTVLILAGTRRRWFARGQL